ncbi:hypothetical protein ACFSCX_06300 [Bacillus salitolerans]|uniref:Uncharacterized protein n=1 Tax=Bacillus salitolerans TaxID=1437434 RepID=A0ABW4LMC0_9BACI
MNKFVKVCLGASLTLTLGLGVFASDEVNAKKEEKFKLFKDEIVFNTDDIVISQSVQDPGTGGH